MYIVLCLFESRMRCRQACDGHAERRAAHVVQTCEVAELHRRRFAAVFAANTAFERGFHLTSFLNGHAHELSNTVLVENGEGVVFQNSFVDVHREEFGNVVAAVTKRHLC